MKPVLHIITQCTDRKKAAVPVQLQMRRYRQRDLDARASAWARALSECDSRVRARDLYAGEHWTASVELERAAVSAGFEAHLWVASAGYGLVSAEAMITPYSATFATGSPDSVVRSDGSLARDRQLWWHAVNEGRKGARTTIGQLGRSSENRLLLVLSRAYLQAVLPEIEEGEGLLGSTERLLIVTGDAPEMASAPWSHHLVPSSARLKNVVGGTRIGQHARLALTLMRATPAAEFSAKIWQARVAAWLDASPQLETYERTPMSDEEVREFVRAADTNSWSRALRGLRDAGRACEQKRFRKIFQEARNP
ncbi:MAG: hypothetical protein ACT4TC_21495 [Myxococcaceae bacterium]